MQVSPQAAKWLKTMNEVKTCEETLLLKSRRGFSDSVLDITDSEKTFSTDEDILDRFDTSEVFNAANAQDVFNREEKARRSSIFSETSFDFERFREESLRSQELRCSKHVPDDESNFVSQENKAARKTVTFGQVHIREHPIVVGVNPGCCTGIPVTIAWNFVTEVETDVDCFEEARFDQRRTLRELAMTSAYRENMLKCLGFTRSEMNWGLKQAIIARNKRQQTKEFLHLQKTHERLESVSRKLKKVLAFGKSKRTDHKLLKRTQKERNTIH